MRYPLLQVPVTAIVLIWAAVIFAQEPQAANAGTSCIKTYPPTKYETPLGPMTDEQIGQQQEDSDVGFAIEQVFPYLDPVLLGAAWQAGRGDIARLAGTYAKEYGKTSGERNALQHALWQALLAYRYGDEIAKAIGDQHEKWQAYGNADRKRDSKADLHNNEIGREIGRELREDSEKKGGSRFVVPVRAIKQAIVEAFFAGRLDLSGGIGGRGVGLCGGQGKIHTLKPTEETPSPDPGNPTLPPASDSPQPKSGGGSAPSQGAGNPSLPPRPNLPRLRWFDEK